MMTAPERQAWARAIHHAGAAALARYEDGILAALDQRRLSESAAEELCAAIDDRWAQLRQIDELTLLSRDWSKVVLS